jgi:hypothetical protein
MDIDNVVAIFGRRVKRENKKGFLVYFAPLFSLGSIDLNITSMSLRVRRRMLFKERRANHVSTKIILAKEHALVKSLKVGSITEGAARSDLAKKHLIPY